MAKQTRNIQEQIPIHTNSRLSVGSSDLVLEVESLPLPSDSLSLLVRIAFCSWPVQGERSSHTNKKAEKGDT